ncbi:hypothetical protein [Brevibacterium sp. VCM10]|uniref:hypothetical protein n=1 Tax=Brevibacterium sp. VCM10 TaxID=1381751 RepID=UPI0018CC6370
MDEEVTPELCHERGDRRGVGMVKRRLLVEVESSELADARVQTLGGLGRVLPGSLRGLFDECSPADHVDDGQNLGLGAILRVEVHRHDRRVAAHASAAQADRHLRPVALGMADRTDYVPALHEPETGGSGRIACAASVVA